MFQLPALVALTQQLKRNARLEAALNLLDWDQETLMPVGAARSRAAARGELAELIHRRYSSEEFGRLVAAAEQVAAAESDRRAPAFVREVRRRFDRRTRVPAELAEELARVTSEAQSVWQRARAANDFAMFRPYLEKNIAVRRRMAEHLRAPGQSLYDALIDEFEPGTKAADIQRLCAAVRPGLVALVQRYGPICALARVDFLSRSFPPATQRAFGELLLRGIGMDFERGVIGQSAHPFCTSIGAPSDVRVTTRYRDNDLKPALFGIIHEGGHALYEQGFAPAEEGTPLAEAASMGIHESQSRTWENIVARSRPFWRHYLPKLKEAFPGTLDDVDVDTFLRGINVVRPSLIRVEADEVTYNLHIMLRFELEQRLFDGTLPVAELPREWNARMQADLGITPPNDTLGVLQDVHWSTGAFGYFPTYFLGNLYAAQFYETAERELPGLAAKIERGQLAPLREWLRERIHVRGAITPAAQLCREVTGRELDPAGLLRYLEQKLGDIYR
ncbi:MAG: carboxypeptidase M32 [Planctomycetota bacterium]